MIAGKAGVHVPSAFKFPISEGCHQENRSVRYSRVADVQRDNDCSGLQRRRTIVPTMGLSRRNKPRSEEGPSKPISVGCSRRVRQNGTCVTNQTIGKVCRSNASDSIDTHQCSGDGVACEVDEFHIGIPEKFMRNETFEVVLSNV